MNGYLINFLRVTGRLLKYAVLIALAILLLTLISLGSAYKNLKAAAAQGLAGKSELTQAAAAAQAKDWLVASNRAAAAQANFSYALENLNQTRTNIAVKYFPLVRNQINDLEYLLKTAEILSRSLERVMPLVINLDQIQKGAGQKNFVDLPLSDKARFLQLIYESEPELNGLTANLKLAVINLDKIHRLGVLWPIYGQISDIKTELGQTAVLMEKLSPLIKLLPALAGYPNGSRFLLILQNNDELRATGGFIGVYGILESKNGEITSLKSDDSYHLDMPASLTKEWGLEPPGPVKKYLKVEKWYLRDANWSPDWPTAAQKINEIFQGESTAIKQPVLPFTGIVAITPDFVTDLIRLVGPITVKGATYNADNFQSLLQYNVEVAYKDQNISSWDRKEIINEIIGELKTRLFSLPTERWVELFKILDHNVITKNIQLYFSNESWENLVRTLGANGEVEKTASDYLLVIDSNLGAFKSDVVVKKNLAYTLTKESGGLKASVKLNYRHEGSFDWRTTRYRSYTRVYAPLGSRLISLDGVDKTTADISVTDDKALAKTVFGFFFTVEPGSAREINLTYNLPEMILKQTQSGAYRLLIQKQAGNRIEGLTVNLLNRLNLKTNLNQDQEFTLD